MRKQPVAKGAPAVTRRFQRVVAVGCTHGDLADTKRLNEVMAFVRRFDPHYRFELGDLIDTAAFRSGSKGTKDEAHPIEPDKIAGVEWIKRYKPTHLSWGNHCWRLVEWRTHYNAVLAYAAGVVWNALEDATRDVGALTVPYHIKQGWFYLGGYAWGHGYMYNESAVRDHAEMTGSPVVMAHLHRALQERGRTLTEKPSFCVGTLMDVDKAHYAERRRATTRWGAGVVFGEICKEDSYLWIATGQTGEPIHFPPGL
jgi:hypothetical protein